MILLLDIGNTRLKWALAAAGCIGDDGAQAHAGAPATVLAQLDCGAVPTAIHIVSVAGAAHEPALDQACRARWRLTPVYARARREQLGLRSGYAQPERLGADRWIAMLGAWRRTQGACIVADAGTALTVDAIDAQGQHLGGIIAAGLRTSEQAVLGATRFATRDAAPPPHGGLGRDTEGCVHQGALLSCLGALDRAAALLPSTARCYLTGGDAPALLPYLRAGWEHRPALVFEGLLEAGAEAPS